MAAENEWAWVARIRHPQGRKGEAWAEVLTDFPDKFNERKQLWLLRDVACPQTDPRPVTLLRHWMHKGGVVLHFEGVDSISAAEELSGLVVAIPRAERAPLAEDEAFLSDLAGCMLVDVAGDAPVEVGPIDDVDQTAGPVALLVIRGAHGEILVPFAKKYLKKIDLDARRVEMDLPAGLVELNG
jgi:16S rRNA processing protein RimM